MKRKLAFLVALTAICGMTNAATMVTYDTPVIAANKGLISSQLSWLTPSIPESWNTSKINFNSVFGVNFNAGLYELKVIKFSSDFGMTGEVNNNVFNSYGVAGSMNKVASGVSSYTGTESYITYDANEPVSLLAYSHYSGQSYDVFNTNSAAFSWTTTELETQNFVEINGQRVLVTDTLTTLLVGFDDSPGIWDSDYNDLVLAVQLVPKGASTSGQPLPGVMAALLLGGGTLAALKRRRMKTAE